MSDRLQAHFQGGGTQLPEVPTVAQLSDRVWVALGMNPGPYSLQGTNTYIVGTGKERILIDTGEGRAEYVGVLQRALRESGTERIAEVVLTHWHGDHIGGVRGLMPVLGAPRVRKLIPTEAEAAWEGEGSANPDELLRGVDITPLSDGDVLRCEGATLRVLHTPGHATDHVVLYLEEDRSLFTGDNVLGTGTPVFRDLPLYLASLRRMLELRPESLYTSHGPVVRDGTELISEYISHREKRVQQVRDALAAAEGAWRTAEEVTRAIYTQVPPNLIPAATVNTIQALRVLGADGLAVTDPPQPQPQQLPRARWRLVQTTARSLRGAL
eukprot:TRINITY_DN23978_c0_g1_i1.p1 TRINITY_DN23978_c0_g1~~TRINITY_DN23978_c0_g1_i1.p1  ORF type:complete len:353 (+),score=113.93 TRINITY_DN23978_c0_g1_i1:83-1060(+)